MKQLLPVIALGTLFAACSSSPTATSDGQTALASCRWPASLDPTDAGPGLCTAKRHRLSCSADAGVFEECISNDPARCEGESVVPGVTFTCQDVCRPDEYAAVCGRVGPNGGSTEPPSPACRAGAFTPAGIAFYCCPCVAP